MFDTVLADLGITVVHIGVQLPRMNAIIERWVRTCRRELMDRTLIWNQRQCLYALREFRDVRPRAPCPSGHRQRAAAEAAA